MNINQLSKKATSIFCAGTALVLAVACGGGGGGDASAVATTTFGNDVPSTYKFKSRFVSTDDDSAEVSGQYFRFVLIKDMATTISNLTGRATKGELANSGDVVSALKYFYNFDIDTSGSDNILMATTPSLSQTKYSDISSTNKDLTSKVAGNDATGQHKTWSDGISFKGWSDQMSTGNTVGTPEKLVLAYFERLEDLHINFSNGTYQVDPAGNNLTSTVYVDSQGRDYKQLIEKFLLVSVAFSQGTDDYLEEGTTGKGLDSNNTVAVDGKSYSSLEHQWDEGFGYFGAARNYNDYTDDEIAASSGRDAFKSGYNDANSDGAIDLKTEVNFGASVNAAKRDRGSSSSATTDFTKNAFDAFLKGRTIITEANGALSTDAMTALKVQRDKAVLNWEKAIAATVVHYCNDTLQDMAKFNTSDYSFTDHAKHWSELKGFALGLQFNPNSPLTDANFELFHQKIGDAPVLPNSTTTAQQITDYKTAIKEAKAILKSAYSFNDANMGDDNGQNGW
jgi:hypothetical protein